MAYEDQAAQVAAAQQAAAAQQQALQQQQQQIQQQHTQQALLQSGLQGMAGRMGGDVALGQIQSQQAQIGEYKQQLSGYSQDIQRAQSAQLSAQQQQQKFETALQVYLGQIKRPAGFDIQDPISKQAAEMARNIEGSHRDVSLSPETQKLLSEQFGSITQKIVQTPVPSTSLSGVSQYSSDFIGPIKPDVTQGPSIIQQVGGAISGFGAGIGNVLRGQSFYTPVTTSSGEKIYPGSSPVSVQSLPSGTITTMTTSGPVYTYQGANYKDISSIPTQSTQQPTLNIVSPISVPSGMLQGNVNVGQTYNPLLGMYTSPSPTGMQGTAYMQPVSPKEIEQWDYLTGPSKTLFGDRASGNLLTANLPRLTGDVKELNKVNKDLSTSIDKINKLTSKNINEKGEWIGSDKDYKKYQDLSSEFDIETQKFQSLGGTYNVDTGEFTQPTIKAGLFGLTRDVPISEVSEITPMEGLAKTVGATLGVRAERGLTAAGIKEVPLSTLGILNPSGILGSGREIPLSTGQLGTRGNILGTVGISLTPSQVGTGVSFLGEQAVQTGKYFVPVAGNIFFASDIAKIPGQIAKDGGVVQYVEKNPLQAVALIGMTLLKVKEIGPVKDILSTRIRISVPEENILRIQGRLNVDVIPPRLLPSSTRTLRVQNKAIDILNTQSKESARNLKEVIGRQKAAAESPYALRGTIFSPEGGLITDKSSTLIGTSANRFFRTVSSEAGKVQSGKISTATSLLIKETGTQLPERINLMVPPSENLGKEFLLPSLPEGYRYINPEPSTSFLEFNLPKLELSPDIGRTESIQLVPTKAITKKGITQIVGSSAGVGARGQPVSIENFVGSGKKGYVYFESYTQKLGRKGIPEIEENILGRSGQRQIVKVTKLRTTEEGRNIILIETRALPRAESKNFYTEDVNKVFNKGKKIGDKTFEKGTPIKTEVYSYKETPSGRRLEFNVALKPGETILSKSIINEKRLSGYGKGIPSKIKEIKEIPSLPDYVITKKTPFSSTFQEEQVQLTAKEFKEISKEIKPSLTTKPSPAKGPGLIESLYPTYVGGTALGETIPIAFGKSSAFTIPPEEMTILRLPPVQQPSVTGKVLISSPPIVSTLPLSVESITSTNIQNKVSYLGNIPESKLEMNMLELKKTYLSQIPESKIEMNMLELKNISILRLAEELMSIQRTEQLQREELASMQRSEFIQLQRGELINAFPYPIGRYSRINPIRKPRTKISPFEFPSKSSLATEISKRKTSNLFIPEVRRRGKFAAISKPTTFETAYGLGIGRIKGTLAASFRIRSTKTGKLVPIAKETREFRPGKKGRDVFTIVQKAPTRLGTAGERSEILLSRKKGGIRFI